MGKLKYAALAFALLLLSFGCAAPGGGTPKHFWVWGWESLIPGAIMVVVLALALGQMAGTFLNDEKIKAWVKHEVGQLVFSLLILTCAVLLIQGLDQWLKYTSALSDDPRWTSYVINSVCCDSSTGACPPGPVRKRACHIELASDYLQLLYDTARLNAVTHLSNYWWYGFLSNLSFSISPLVTDKGPGFSIRPFAGLAMPADFFSVLFELAVKIMMLLRAQQVFLDYISYIILPVFMSMGIVLRMMYFTRKLGGLLIALALSVYIVFPMFYVVSDYILFQFLGGWTVAQGPQTFGQAFNSDTANGGTAMPFDSGTQADYGDPGNSKEVFTSGYQQGQTVNVDLCSEDTDNKNSGTLLRESFGKSWGLYEHGRWYEQAMDWIGFDAAAAAPGKNSAFGSSGPIATLAMLMVFSLFLPFLALMTTLASVKVLSPLIGGDVEISVISRLI